MTLRSTPIFLLFLVFIPISPTFADEIKVKLSDIEAGKLYFATDTPGKVIAAPLLKADVTVDISGPVARVKVVQSFTNTTAKWVEGIYTFPLPDKSAVDTLRMYIGERMIEGVIKEKHEARKTYATAKQQGKRASLVSQERPNIFTTEVANIDPGATIRIEIEYQESLRFDAGDFEMRFPMVIRPRYNPGTKLVEHSESGSGWHFDSEQVPDASRITPPIHDPLAAKINPLTMTINLKPGFAIDEINSLYHGVTTTQVAGRAWQIKLAEGEVPTDRDFVLKWHAKEGITPQAGFFSENKAGKDHHLMLIMPPKAPLKALEGRMSDKARELVIMLDKSGSMGGEAMIQAKEAVRFAIDRLKIGDMFNIIAFDSTPNPLFTQSEPVTSDSLRRASNFINRINAGGGTEMSAALNIALPHNLEQQLPLRQVIFITDGAVGNEQALMMKIHQDLGKSRLFTVGIGSAPNSFFMTEAAEAGRGTFTYINDTKEITNAMGDMFKKIEAPVLTDIKINWPNGLTDFYPAKVPDLYQGEPITLVARSDDAVTGDITIEGLLGGKAWSRTVKMQQSQVSAGIASIWARRNILDQNRAHRRGELGSSTLKQVIVPIALAYGLISDYTSLVAVDKTPARPEGDALYSQAVPTNLPAGMKAEDWRGMEPSQRKQFIASNSHKLKPDAALSMPKGATAMDILMIMGLILILISLIIMRLSVHHRLKLDDA